MAMALPDYGEGFGEFIYWLGYSITAGKHLVYFITVIIHHAMK